MNKRKPRILMVNESSFLHTGYAVYGNEVLSRLHNTGKYEVAELGCYGKRDDPRAFTMPWKHFFNIPEDGSPAMAEYEGNITSQFGALSFEKTCLEFCPDIVFDIRDAWYFTHQEHSPFRPYYNWALMPTVDSAPQDEAWLSMYMNADGVFAYTKWGYEVLKTEANGLIKLKGVASPGVNHKTEFVPVLNKKEHKSKAGLRDDILIIGTIMRNQKRKQYPDLIEAFAKFIEKAPTSIAKRTFLYLHTGYPDIGWDLPRLLKIFGVANKVLFTYMCRNCGISFPQFYSDARCVCPKCHTANVTLPDTKVAVSRKMMGEIINLFDVYVQYAICGGFEMPIVEAAGCGIPVMATDYSAMSDVIRQIKGTPLKIGGLFCEAETGCYRSWADQSDLVDKLIQFFSLPETMRYKKGRDTRKCIENKIYDWDNTARQWENYFDSVELKDINTTWKSPPRILPNVVVPEDIKRSLPNQQFVAWAIHNILKNNRYINSHVFTKLVKELNWGCELEGFGGVIWNDMSTLGAKPKYKEFNRDGLIQHLEMIRNTQNYWEQQRGMAIQNGHIDRVFSSSSAPTQGIK